MYPQTNLTPGMTGDAVKKLQDFLVQSGAMTQAQVNTGYGTYGPQTKAAVAQWQQQNGVQTNSSTAGYWGPLSIAAAQNTTKPQQATSLPTGQYTSTPQVTPQNFQPTPTPTPIATSPTQTNTQNTNTQSQNTNTQTNTGTGGGTSTATKTDT